MSTLFIADLHLTASAKHLTQLFKLFIDQHSQGAEAVYILGDLFHVWLGDDDQSDYHQMIIQYLRQLTTRGTRLFIMPGNRDVLLSQQFCAACQATLLTDPCVIELDGQKAILTHGDLLCTADNSHQRFRTLTHNRFIRKLFLTLPLSWRQRLASSIHRYGRSHYTTAIPAKFDATPQAINALLTEQHSKLLIHGHTHQPAIHYYQLANQPALRIVLSDWLHQGHYLQWQSEQYQLKYFSC